MFNLHLKTGVLRWGSPCTGRGTWHGRQGEVRYGRSEAGLEHGMAVLGVAWC